MIKTALYLKLFALCFGGVRDEWQPPGGGCKSGDCNENGSSYLGFKYKDNFGICDWAGRGMG